MVRYYEFDDFLELVCYLDIIVCYLVFLREDGSRELELFVVGRG